MKVRLWGTRGSIPISSPQMSRYGGDTTCIEVLSDAGDRLIIDAGTGIHSLGSYMDHEAPGPCTICFTHTHWDHIQGLPHFRPLYNPQWSITLYGTHAAENASFEQSLLHVFNENNFPVHWKDLPPRAIKDFAPGDSFTVGTLTVRTCPTVHPGGCVAYRIEGDGWSFAFTGDHECDQHQGPERQALLDFLAGADIVLADGHYFDHDYLPHKGWGHSSFSQWPEELALRKVKNLIYTHFDPSYSDNDLDDIADTLSSISNIRCILGRQNMTITAKGGELDTLEDLPSDTSCALCDFFHHISRFSETNVVLDSILTQARSLSNADAGTIYLVENDELIFSYTQNDTLFPGSAANKFIYLNASLPLDSTSIGGFVACSGKALNIPDVRAIPASEPYTFNDNFDLTTGYRTVSMLTVPFTDAHDSPLGVLQLINSHKNGVPQPFSPGMIRVIGRLVMLAANSLERARTASDMILRMLKTSALRDPRETASHVRRVGSMAAEIYHHWAERHGLPREDVRYAKGQIRMAAMLHDVGKVGIPDAILKKPGPLTPEERKIIETHSALGAHLFNDATQGVEILARDIALHHHQKWDGTGYTGSPSVPQLSGEDIPLEARITAIADVYDALISRRCYKDAWSVAEAVDIIRKDAGRHFDPELVEVFLDIPDVIAAIHTRYPDTDEV